MKKQYIIPEIETVEISRNFADPSDPAAISGLATSEQRSADDWDGWQ